METKELIRDGRNWITCEYLCYGDYDNSGAVERSNVRVLTEDDSNVFNVSMSTWYEPEDAIYNSDFVIPENITNVLAYGAYNSVELWLLDNETNRDIIKGLSDYPCIDDEDVSFLKMEMEQDAWDSWIRDDLLSLDVLENLEENHPDMFVIYSFITDWIAGEDFMKPYYEAKEDCNVYFEVEAGGNTYVDTDAIRDTFIQKFYKYLRTYKRKIEEIKGQLFMFQDEGSE